MERLTVTATPTQTAPSHYVILYLRSFIPAHNNTVSARLHLILDSLPLLLSSTSEAAHVSKFCHPPSSSRLFLSPNPSFPFNHSPFCSCAASEDSRKGVCTFTCATAANRRGRDLDRHPTVAHNGLCVEPGED